MTVVTAELKPDAVSHEVFQEMSHFSAEKTVYVMLKRPPSRSFIEVQGSKASLKDAFQLVNKFHVHALPVYERRNGKKEYIGLMSVIDLLKFAMLEPVLSQGTRDITPSSRKEILATNAAFLKKNVSEVLGSLPTDNRPWRWRSGDSLDSLLVAFSQGLHRVMIDSDGEHPLPVVISQSDVLAYLLSSSSAFPHAMVTPASAIMTKDPFTVSTRTRALDAFLDMNARNVNAVAVVDPDTRRLTAHLSAFDLSSLDKTNAESLNFPVTFFLHTVHGQMRVPVACKETDTIHTIMSTLSKHAFKRVWIVNSQSVLVGVISLTDVIRHFVSR